MIERAVDTYIRIWRERDPVARAELIEACWAENGRLVTRSRVYRGRGELAELATRILADPDLVDVRVVALDARGTTFRLRGIAEYRDGRTAEAFDAGEVDADGRIATLLTFDGPM